MRVLFQRKGEVLGHVTQYLLAVRLSDSWLVGRRGSGSVILGPVCIMSFEEQESTKVTQGGALQNDTFANNDGCSHGGDSASKVSAGPWCTQFLKITWQPSLVIATQMIFTAVGLLQGTVLTLLLLLAAVLGHKRVTKISLSFNLDVDPLYLAAH